ncbi:MAG: NADP-dependent oxidoreductase [Terriglobia bacterium]
MSEKRNRRIVLAARPHGEPRAEDFRMEAVDLQSPADGQVLLRTIYLSLDPYMRGRMNEGPSYAAPVEIGEVMQGGTISAVVESRSTDFSVGDFVLGYTGWQEYAVAAASSLQKLDPARAPLSTALGVLGMPGLTAYAGLLNIGQPKPGETVVVAAASGAVGSVVGQIAKIKGCRPVGIAGGTRKCDYVVNELGFDACLDHHDAPLAQNLKAACPNGVDVYFENVGGRVFNAVLPLMNPFGRVPVCGLISQYNLAELARGIDRVPLLMGAILVKRLTFRGFIVRDFIAQKDDFARDITQWLRAGKVKYREDVVEGLENAVTAFQGLLQGRNFGKLLVRLAPDPTIS